MSEIRLNSIVSTDIQKTITKQGDTLIGIPVEFEFSENGVDDEVLTLYGFFCVNPKEAQNASELYLDLSLDPNFETNEYIKNAAKELFKDKVTGIKTQIQKTNPDFFNQINKICFEAKNNGASRNITESVLNALIHKNSKPLLIQGLAGYGKTSIINSIFKDIENLSFSAEDFAKKYAISIEKAKELKEFKNNMRTLPINATMNIYDMYGHATLISHPKTKQQVMDYANSTLMEVVKGISYGGQKGIICLDELLDNTDIITQLKATIMASNGVYNFTPNYSRDFLEIKSPFKIKTANGDFADLNYAIFEIAKNADKRFAVDDKCINLTEDGNSFVIDSAFLNAHQKDCFYRSTVGQNLNKKISDPNSRDYASTMANITNHKFAELNSGARIFLISQAKAEEIQASNINHKTSSEEKPFIISTTELKILATGNVLNNVPQAALDRFAQCSVDRISYDELLNNFAVLGIGIDSEFINKLKDKTPDNSSTIEYVNIILDFVKHLAHSQHDGELSSPQFDMGKEPVFREGFLSSAPLNPRMITSIINNSSSPEDVIKNFKNNAYQILGIEGYPDDNEENDVVRFNDKVDEILAKNLISFCNKYKIENAIEESNPVYNKLIDDIPMVNNIFSMPQEQLAEDEILDRKSKIKI